MMISYLELQKQASQMLKEFGKPMTLRKSRFIFDGDIGETIEEIIAEQIVTVVQAGFEHRLIDGTAISVEDVRFYVGADSLDLELANMEPISEMKLIDNVTGRAWQFKHVRSISPGDVTVLFDVQAY